MHTTLRALITAAFCLLSVAVYGQSSPPATWPTFETASVRVIPDDEEVRPGKNPRRTEGQLTWTMDVDEFITYAYDVPHWQVLGVKSPRKYYTVAATLPPSTPPDDVRLMFRALLRDRFHLVTHTQVEERAGFALVVGARGTKMQATPDGEPIPPMPKTLENIPPALAEGLTISSIPDVGVRSFVGRRVTVSQLARQMSEVLSAFVQDRTGLSGRYYVDFLFAPTDVPDSDGRAPTIFAAVEDTLGLRLERTRGPVTMLVVDRVDRTPTPN